MNAEGSIMVYLQAEAGVLLPVCLEMVGAGQLLAAETGRELCGLWIGGGADVSTLRGLGLRRVYLCEGGAFRFFDAELYGHAAEDCAREAKPWAILFGSTPESKAVSAWLNTRLGTGITADCTQLSVTPEGLLLQTRPAFMGDVMASILTPSSLPQMATVRQGMFPPPVRRGEQLPQLLHLTPSPFSPRLRILDRKPLPQQGEGLAESRRVLAVGGGVRQREDLALFAAAAESLGAALGCSRALVERGWMPHEAQIGMSGAVLKAQTLITLGISGSTQFTAGIRRVGCILAVNTDPQAPIFAEAAVGWQCDMYEATESLLRMSKEKGVCSL